MSLKKSHGWIILSEAICVEMLGLFFPLHSLLNLSSFSQVFVLPDRINHQLWWKKNKGSRGKQKELQYFIENVKHLKYISKNYRSCQLWVCVHKRDVIFLIYIFCYTPAPRKMNYTSSHFFSRTSWVSKSANATWAADWLNPACKHFIYIHSHVRHTNVRNILNSSMHHWIIFKLSLVRQSRWCQIYLLSFIWPSRAVENFIYLI